MVVHQALCFLIVTQAVRMLLYVVLSSRRLKLVLDQDLTQELTQNM